jgi:glutathione S-transferase
MRRPKRTFPASIDAGIRQSEQGGGVIGLYHGGACGHSAAVLIALAEKRLTYDERPIDLRKFEQFDQDFLEISPTGQVPVLEDDDGNLLNGSFAILLWLDQAHPNPPLGGEDEARRAVHEWGQYLETQIAPNLAIWRWAQLGGEAPPEELLVRLPPESQTLWRRAAAGFSAEEVERARLALVEALDRMAADIAQGGWLAGEDYSLADVAVYPHVAQLAELGIEVPYAVEEWLTRIAVRPAVREAAGDLKIIATMGG